MDRRVSLTDDKNKKDDENFYFLKEHWEIGAYYFLNGTLGELIEKVNLLYNDVRVITNHPEEAILTLDEDNGKFTIDIFYTIEKEDNV